jgi:CRP-like cAMP-binding protein
MLHSTFGVSADGNLNIILTREELANIVGTATESVIRLLSDFKSEGLISLSGKKIRLENIKKLEKLSKSFF